MKHYSPESSVEDFYSIEYPSPKYKISDGEEEKSKEPKSSVKRMDDHIYFNEEWD